MAVTEASRFELHKYFEETMGRERATTMMELLPPVGWGDVATKHDVASVRQEIAGLREWAGERFATKEGLQKVHVDLLRELRIHTVTLVTVMIALAGLIVSFG